MAEKRVQVGIKFLPSLLLRVDAAARDRGITRTAFFELAAEALLEGRVEPPTPENAPGGLFAPPEPETPPPDERTDGQRRADSFRKAAEGGEDKATWN